MLLLSALALADAFPGALDECESVMSTLLNIGALSGMLWVKHPQSLNSNCTQSICSHAPGTRHKKC